MVSFERGCLSGRSCRNRSAGSWCGTSNRLAGLLQRRSLPLRNLDERILIRSLGGIVQNHCQTHTSFRNAGLRSLGRVALISFADGKVLLEHPLSHVIVFGAALQFHVRLDADFSREDSLNFLLRPFLPLPAPPVPPDAPPFPTSP